MVFVRGVRRMRRWAANAANALNVPRAPKRPAQLDLPFIQDHLGWFVRRRMRALGAPGVSIALVDDRGLLWADGFGYADRERRIRTTAETVYQVGSITKVLTALAVMQLVDEGRVDLDAPFTDYVPEFSIRTRWPDARAITPRALLCHHSGLPTFHLKGFFSSETLESLLGQLRGDHLAYEPHTVFNYSNLGSNLLGLMLARLTGERYEDAMTRRLLAPLEMTHSGFVVAGNVRAQLARGYVHDRPTHPTPVRDVPAGGLYSNVLDLARFMQMVLGKGALEGRRVMSARALDQSLTPQYPDCRLDFGQRFGLGWMLSGLSIEHSGPQAWHNGGTKAFLSQMILLPERKLGVVVLTNADCAGPIAYEAADEALRLALEWRHGLVPTKKIREPEIAVERGELARHVGDYSLMGSLARISLGKKRLRLHVLNHKLELVPVAADRFRVEYSLLGLKSVPIPFPPVEVAAVGARRFVILRDRVLVPAERIPSYDIPPSWQRCAGDYRVLNPDAEYLVDLDRCRVEIAGGRLLIDIRISGIENREVQVVLMPISDREAYVFGIGRNVGDVATILDEDGPLRVRYAGYFFERLG